MAHEPSGTRRNELTMRSGTRWIPLLFLFAACAPEPEPETPYGSVDDVSRYLQAVNPYVQEIGQINARFEEGLGSSTDDQGRRRGTGRNLAEAAEVVQNLLRHVLGDFEKIEPPPLLAPFHRDTKELILSRLDAYETMSRGWDTQQVGGDFEPIYRQAESKLEAANALIQRLNSEMLKINTAVQQAGEAQAQASS